MVADYLVPGIRATGQELCWLRRCFLQAQRCRRTRPEFSPREDLAVGHVEVLVTSCSTARGPADSPPEQAYVGCLLDFDRASGEGEWEAIRRADRPRIRR